MPRIPRLVLFKMVNEKFAFFIFSHLSFSCQKRKKKKAKNNLFRKSPLWETPKLIFHLMYLEIEDPVSKCRKNDRVHTALV